MDYKIRRFTNGRNKEGEPFINYSLTVPSKIAESLADDMRFECVVLDTENGDPFDGILFKPSAGTTQETALPKWAKGNGTPAPAATKPPVEKKRSARKRPAPKKSGKKSPAARKRPGS